MLRFAFLLTAVGLLAGCAGEPATSTPEADPARRDSAPATGVPAPSPDSTSAEAAVAVIRAYYAAIEAGDYRRAYGYWGDDGKRSGQSFEAFREGFTETASVRVEAGPPGRVEGAAGSRYVEVPVTAHAVTTDGREQRFEGTYTLRRAVVDGATPAQRRWHFYDADIAPVEP